MKKLFLALITLVCLSSCESSSEIKYSETPVKRVKLLNAGDEVGSKFDIGTFEHEGHKYIYWLSTGSHSVSVEHDPACLIEDIKQAKGYGLW